MASTRGRQVVIPLTNKSGGAVAAGDVVIIDTGNDAAFTTTTSGRSEVSIGIAQEAIADNASGKVLVAGHAALVNVPASVTRGHYVETHTVAKQATGNSTRRSGSFGQFLTGGTTPTAVLWGQTDQTAVGSATPPDCLESAMTSDVTMGTPNTWTDSGLSLSLAAGTWLVEVCLLIRTTQTGATQVAARICNNDASTVYGVTPQSMPSNNGQETFLRVHRRITLGGTTTVKVQGIDIVRTAVIVADPADAAVADNITSYMTALNVTAA